jgi:hypothetical protein
MGGSSLSGPLSTLVTRTGRAPWPEPATPRGRRRHKAVAVGWGVSVRRRGTGDHQRLTDGTEKMGEREKKVQRGNSPWVGQERW